MTTRTRIEAIRAKFRAYTLWHKREEAFDEALALIVAGWAVALWARSRWMT